jgi:outer membrane murein-binding lipoprotein Lpp
MPDLTPVAEAVVQTTNGGSIRAGVWTTAVVAVIGLFGLIIKQIGPWRKQTTDAEGLLREKLSARVDGLEKQVDALRAELLAQAARSEKIIADIRAQHALEMQQTRERHLLDLASALSRKIDGEKR